MKAFFGKIKKFVADHKVWTSVIAGVLVLAILAGIFLPTLISVLSGKCKVTFETNGGKECATIWVEKGQPISAEQLPTTTKDGHRFYGWFTDEALSLIYVDAAVNNDMTLYAGFSVNEGPKEVDYPEVYIGTIEPDFALAVASSEKLTNDNIGEHITLTVNYGKHADGTPITLTVKENGQGKYLVSANYASPGNYAISIVSGSVSIDMDNAEMEALGLSEFTQKITFTTSGDNVENLTYSDAFTEISNSDILAYSETAVQVASGKALSANDVISLPGANDFGFVKVVKEISASEAQKAGLVVANTDGSSKFYSVVRAKVNDVYDDMDVYKTEEIDPDLYLAEASRFADEMAETLKNDPKIDAFTRLLLQSASYTPEYQKLTNSTGATAMNTTVSVVPLAGTAGSGNSVLSDIAIVPDISKVKDPEFASVMNAHGNFHEKEFIKVSLPITRQISVTRKVGANLIVTASVTLDYYIYLGAEGKWVSAKVGHDFRAGVVLGTHTSMDFTVSLSVEGSQTGSQTDVTQGIRDKLNNLTDAEAEQVMSLYAELVPSANSNMVDIYNKELFEVPAITFYGFQLSIPVELNVSVDFRVALSAKFSAMKLDKVGVEGNTGKLTKAEIYEEHSRTRTSYTVQIQGKIELRAGLSVSVELTFADIEELGYIKLKAEAGVYLELHGMGYATNVITDGVLGACGGAYYFEMGFYVTIDFEAELFSLIGGKITIWEDKYPVLTHGNKELLYGFAKPSEDKEIIFGAEGVFLQSIPGLLDVYTYDITRERTALQSVNGSNMVGGYLTASFDNSKFKYDYNGRLYLRADALATTENETATMVLRYETCGLLSINKCITKTVKVRFVSERLKNVDPELLSKTCTVTLKYDGTECKTYKYPYGSALPSKYTLRYGGNLVLVDGKYDYEHRDIPEELYKESGILAMEFTTPGGYITEDIVLENGVPTEYATWDHTFNYIDNTGCWVSKTITLKHCEVPDLTELEAACPSYLHFMGWNTEIVPNRFCCVGSYYPYEITAQYGSTNKVDLIFEIDDDVTMRDYNDRVVVGRHFCLPYSDNYGHYLDYTAEKEGYNFIGWKCTFSTEKDAIGQTYKAFSGDLPATNFSYFTLEPVFEKKPCAITFKDGDNVSTEYYNVGDVIEVPNMQWAEEYITGWTSEKDGTFHRATYTVTANDTLIPRYEKDAYFVIIDLDGGYFPDGGDNCTSMYVANGDTLSDIGTPVINRGDGKEYIFSHWSKPIDQPITADTTFVAIYKEVKEELKTFTVTYDLNGGKMPSNAKLPEGATVSADGSKISFTVTEGDYAPDIESPILVKGDGKNYGFVEWTPGFEPITKDTTYKAVFEEIIQVGPGEDVDNPVVPGVVQHKFENGVLTIYGTGKIANYLVDSEGQNVRPWDANYDKITKIVIEDGITYIGNHAFSYLPNLTTVEIADSVTSAGFACFMDCGKLTNVKLSKNMVCNSTTYDQTDGNDFASMFSGCTSLKTITLPSGFERVPFQMFHSCESLQTINLPNNLKLIEWGAFTNCTSLKTVVLPASVKTIEMVAFSGCTALESININDSMDIADDAFDGCTSLKR